MAAKLKVGLYATTQFTPETDLGNAKSELVEQVRLARASGFSSLWLPHHYLTQPMKMLATIPMLAYLAREAEGMTVGPNILVVPLLNPVHVAEDALRVPGQRQAGRGGRDAARMALEQRGADGGLQVGNPLARRPDRQVGEQRALADAAGAHHVAEQGQRDEVKAVQVHETIVHQVQCDETNSAPGNAGGRAKVARIRLASAAGVRPNSRRNSRLNCDGLV